MTMDFRNAYGDETRADAYARLQFPGTYYLAYRDLPALIAMYATGTRALDFGCGTGRSSRFLTEHGFRVTGIDIAPEMVEHARRFDPEGDYHVVPDGDPGAFASESFDLVLSSFTFDNIPTMEKKVAIFAGLRRALKRDGRLINLVSTPEIYCHEWMSFSTKDYPQNRLAKCGDSVLIVNTDIDDARPVEDIVWPDEDYREVYRKSGLEILGMHKPLGREDEPFDWVTETKLAPWAIYVLRKQAPPPAGR